MIQIVDNCIHYAMMFVNPKGVEHVMNVRRLPDVYKGFTIVNNDAEDKTRRARAGEIIQPKNDLSIAEAVQRRKNRSAKVVQESVVEVDL